MRPPRGGGRGGFRGGRDGEGEEVAALAVEGVIVVVEAEEVADSVVEGVTAAGEEAEAVVAEAVG